MSLNTDQEAVVTWLAKDKGWKYCSDYPVQQFDGKEEYMLNLFKTVSDAGYAILDTGSYRPRIQPTVLGLSYSSDKARAIKDKKKALRHDYAVTAFGFIGSAVFGLIFGILASIITTWFLVGE